MSTKNPSVAILGATGAVGQEFIRLIEERNFPYSSLKLLASKRSEGKKLTVNGKEYTVEEAKPESFEGVDIGLFAGGALSKKFSPPTGQRGGVVFFKPPAFPLGPRVPLGFSPVKPYALS